MYYKGPRYESVPQETTIIAKAMDLYEHDHATGSYVMTRQPNAQLGYVSEGIFATTGSNIFIGNQTIEGQLTISSSSSPELTVIGNTVITGSLDVDGNINVASGSEFYLAGNKLFNYGQFYDTTTQSGSANTAYAMKLNNVDFAHEVLLVNGTQIKVLNTGIYNLQFSAQLSNTANTNIVFDIWLAYTGSNYPHTTGQVDVNKTAGQLGRTIAAWNYMLPIKANDYVELYWSADQSTGEILATGTQSNPDRPEIPSVIVTLTQVG